MSRRRLRHSYLTQRAVCSWCNLSEAYMWTLLDDVKGRHDNGQKREAAFLASFNCSMRHASFWKGHFCLRPRSFLPQNFSPHPHLELKRSSAMRVSRPRDVGFASAVPAPTSPRKIPDGHFLSLRVIFHLEIVISGVNLPLSPPHSCTFYPNSSLNREIN